MAALMIATVWIISACYSRIIERFPQGGGGYVVASALLGRKAGVVSGSALLVDYVLTITISIAAAGDALFSFLPGSLHGLKLPTEVVLIVFLTAINVRGVKESILTLMPVFLLFLATHAVLIGGGIVARGDTIGRTAREVGEGFQDGVATLGLGGLLLLFVHAYSLGGGTYTGIEAVSNGLPIMREPRVRTGKRTMALMAVSLAVTAAGLVVCYLLWDVTHVPGKTFNAVLAERVGAHLSLGDTFVVLTLVAEGALLVVAAQAGFLDGPRVLANMASDGWAPRRFAALSDRLTTRNGIVLMGVAALAALLYTGGDVRHIVVMYSINVFLTFTLSMLAMAKAQAAERRAGRPWRKPLALFLVGLAFCATILGITVREKFDEGGWITLAVTTALVLALFGVRRHYVRLDAKLTGLYASLVVEDLPVGAPPGPLDPAQPTAALLVGGYTGLGIHTTLAALRAFPGTFKNVVFVSVATVDSAALKEEGSVDRLRRETEKGLLRYVALAERHGVAATLRSAVGTDVVEELEALCLDVAVQYPRTTFFAGQLVFGRARWMRSLLHNETAFALQRRLQAAGKTMVILPARVD
jgi:amino acid transporter